MVTLGFNLRAVGDKAATLSNLVLIWSVVVKDVRLGGRVFKDDGLVFKATREAEDCPFGRAGIIGYCRSRRQTWGACIDNEGFVVKSGELALNHGSGPPDYG